MFVSSEKPQKINCLFCSSDNSNDLTIMKGVSLSVKYRLSHNPYAYKLNTNFTDFPNVDECRRELFV